MDPSSKQNTPASRCSNNHQLIDTTAIHSHIRPIESIRPPGSNSCTRHLDASRHDSNHNCISQQHLDTTSTLLDIPQPDHNHTYICQQLHPTRRQLEHASTHSGHAISAARHQPTMATIQTCSLRRRQNIHYSDHATTTSYHQLLEQLYHYHWHEGKLGQSPILDGRS